MKHFFLLFLVTATAFISNAQNVGIGTTTPTDQLHTTGSVKFEKYKGNSTRLLQVDSAGRLYVPGTVTTDNVGFNISDNGCASGAVHQKSITVSGQPLSVSSSKIAVRVNITHPYVADLQLFLISPNGSQILHLASSDGGAGDDLVNTVFTDEATVSFSAVAATDAPFTGKYKPHGSLGSVCLTNANIATFSAFGTGGLINPNGTWSLRIADDAANDVGTFNSWSISFTGTDAFAADEQNNYLPKFSNGNLIPSSIYQQPVTNKIGIGIANPFYNLDVNGSIHNTGTTNVDGNAFFNASIYTAGNAYFAKNAHFDDSIVIGIAVPKAKLDINNGRLRFSGSLADGNAHGIEFTNNTGSTLNGFYGVYNDSTTGFYGYAGAGWSLLFNNVNGNLGLQGKTNPRVPISFSNAVGNKISLYDNGDGTHYGIGLQAAQLQFYVPSASQDIVFGTGSSTALVEKMRVKGNGNVGIGVNPTEKLEVAGNIKVAGSATAATFSTNTGSVLGNGLFVNGDGNINGDLSIYGTARIAGGTPAAGKILTATDANGNAVWQSQSPQATAFFAALSADWPITYSGSLGTQAVIPFVDNTATNLVSPAFDNGAAFNNTTHRFAAATTGFYHFNFKVNYELYGVGFGTPIPDFYMRAILHVVDGSGDHEMNWPIVKYASNSPAPHGQEGSIDLKLQAGSTVYIAITSDNNYSIKLIASDDNRFTGYRVY